MTVESDIYKEAVQYSGLLNLGVSFYPNRVPIGGEYPCVVYRRVSGPEETSLGAYHAVQTLLRIQFTIHSKDKAELETIVPVLKSFLTALSVTTVKGVQVLNQVDADDSKMDTFGRMVDIGFTCAG